jgi:hypothetical protein
MAGEPIKLGSALQPRLIFKDGSTITTDSSGIQACSVTGQCADGANVFNYVPLAGATFDSVFGNNYLPATFKVDYTGGGAQITYLKGGAAEVQLSFKRPDPVLSGPASRQISLDTAVVYKNPVWLTEQTGVDGLNNTVAFYDPTVTVKYNSPTQPIIGGTNYALPGSAAAAGFPTVTDITYDLYLPLNPVSGVIGISHLQIVFGIDPQGWQRTGVKSTPVADQSAFSIEETWRMFYVLKSANVI